MPNPVLIVDDHHDARDVLKRLITYGGFPVATAVNGKDALDQVDAGLRPCLILLDVMMPIMDGPTFAEQLRASPDQHLANTPIVLVTGGFDVETAAKRAQAAGVLRKPVSLERLIEAVKCHCRADAT